MVFYSNIPNGIDCDKVAVDDSRVEKWTTSPPHAVIDALDRFSGCSGPALSKVEPGPTRLQS